MLIIRGTLVLKKIKVLYNHFKIIISAIVTTEVPVAELSLAFLHFLIFKVLITFFYKYNFISNYNI